MADASEMSKSARKRANQKARAAEAAAAEAPAPAVPEPAPKSKAAAKPKAQPAAEPKAQPAPEAKASAKGKAKAKAEPKAAEPAPPPAAKADAKAKAKGKAEPKPAEPKAAETKPAEPKSKAASKKAAAKAKAAKEEPEEPVKSEAAGPLVYYEIDNGGGGDWEVSSGLSKQAQKRKERADEKAKAEKEMAKAGVVEAKANQHIPGLAPAEVQVQQAQGKKSKQDAKAAANQLVTAMASVTAAAVAAKAQEQEKVAAAPDNSVSVSIKVPEPKIGRVVGPKGSNVTMIKEKCGVKTIDMSGDMCTIVGPPDGVVLAEAAVRQLIEKGYMALAYDDFEEEGVPVLPTSFPDLIGKGGAIIQVIKKEAKVEIDIPAVPKTPPPGKKYKVNVAGSKAGVALAKEIIDSIATYGHHQVTHPGQTHQEMEIEEWRYRFLIGSKGSEMRHIQNNYKVKVNIPREHSTCQNVLVVGEERDVERAMKYIEKVLYEADQPKGRGATEKATDDWGDEGEVEDWMKPYMYQRK